MVKCVSVLVAALVLLGVTGIGGKVFTKCELVRQLRRMRFPENDLRDWICLIEHESHMSTDTVRLRKNGALSFGLFQITAKYACSLTSVPGKACDVTCNDMISTNIKKAAKCALMIQRTLGFYAWSGWKTHCQKESLPGISKCKRRVPSPPVTVVWWRNGNGRH